MFWRDGWVALPALERKIEREYFVVLTKLKDKNNNKFTDMGYVSLKGGRHDHSLALPPIYKNFRQYI